MGRGGLSHVLTRPVSLRPEAPTAPRGRVCSARWSHGGSGRLTVSSSPPAPSGLERDKFDNKTVSFEEHIKFEHNMWNYLYFIVLVRVKNKTDYTGPESYVAQMIKVWPWGGAAAAAGEGQLGTAGDTCGHPWKGRPHRSLASCPSCGGASELFCAGSVVRKSQGRAWCPWGLWAPDTE